MFKRIAKRAEGIGRVSCSLYNIWHSMRERCLCATYRDYKYYGGRGITICAEWSDYGAFRAWALSHGFCKGMTLDREDGNGNYEPGNCRWIPRGAQQENIRRAIMLTLNGDRKSLYRWARITGLSPDLLRTRHYNGWTDEQILTTPVLATGVWRPGVQHGLRGRAAAKAKRLAAMGNEGR